MKIQFRIRGLNANANLRGWLGKQLERFLRAYRRVGAVFRG